MSKMKPVPDLTAPTPSIAVILWVHEVLADAASRGDAVTAGFCAQLLGATYMTLRMQLAARSGSVERVGDMLVGQTGVDYKKPPGTPGRNGRPMMAAVWGVDGSELWSHVFLQSAAPPGATEPCVIRDFEATSADPRQALGTVGGTGQRTARSWNVPCPAGGCKLPSRQC